MLYFPLLDVRTWGPPLLLISTRADIWLTTTSDSRRTFQRSRRDELGEPAAQETSTDGFTVLLGAKHTLSSAFPINCALTPSNNFTLM